MGNIIRYFRRTRRIEHELGYFRFQSVESDPALSTPIRQDTIELFLASEVRKPNDASTETQQEHILQDYSTQVHETRQCEGCNILLVIGVAYFVCAGHVHTLCINCTGNSYYQTQECLYCCKENTATVTADKPEVRNSLPLLQDAGPMSIRPGSSALKYQYPILYSTPSIQSLSYTGPVQLPNEAYTCWPSGFQDVIIVGGWRQPTLTVVSGSANVVQHRVSCGSGIVSGVFIKQWMYILCMCSLDNYDDTFDTNFNKIYIICLDPTSVSPSLVAPIATLDIDNPTRGFKISKRLFGVMCMSGNDPYANSKIHILSLESLVLDPDTDPKTIQSIALWGKRALLHLYLPKPDPLDTVAVTPSGNYCISSWRRSEIRIYNRTGTYLYTIGEVEMSKPVGIYPGKLWYPKSIECTADGTLVITGDQGDIQCYDMGSETGRIVDLRDSKGRVYERYNSNDEGWWLLKGIRMEGRVLYGIMTRTQRYAIDNRNMRILHVYNITHKV